MVGRKRKSNKVEKKQSKNLWELERRQRGKKRAKKDSKRTKDVVR